VSSIVVAHSVAPDSLDKRIRSSPDIPARVDSSFAVRRDRGWISEYHAGSEPDIRVLRAATSDSGDGPVRRDLADAVVEATLVKTTRQNFVSAGSPKISAACPNRKNATPAPGAHHVPAKSASRRSDGSGSIATN